MKDGSSGWRKFVQLQIELKCSMAGRSGARVLMNCFNRQRQDMHFHFELLGPMSTNSFLGPSKCWACITPEQAKSSFTLLCTRAVRPIRPVSRF
jgi:hypothetical protein